MDWATFISLIALGVSLLALYATRFSGPSVGFGIGSWIGVSFNPSEEGGKNLRLVIDISATNSGARAAFIQDIVLRVRSRDTNRSFGMVALGEITPRPMLSFDPSGKGKILSFTCMSIPGHETLNATLMFKGIDALPLEEFSPGTYEIELRYSLWNGKTEWHDEPRRERCIVIPELTSKLLDTPVEEEGLPGKTGPFVRDVLWVRTEDSNEGLQAFKRAITGGT